MATNAQANDLIVRNLGVTGSIQVDGTLTAAGLVAPVTGDITGNLTGEVNAAKFDCNATGVGFYGTTPIAKPTGVAVDAAGIHAALVALGLIGA